MVIIVTGGTGSVGRSLIPLLAPHHKVYNLSRHKLGRNDCIDLEIDLGRDWNESMLPDDAEVIIHLAQSEDFRNFPEKAESIFNVNTLSTLRLAEFARKKGIKKFIYASSGGVYGNRDTGFDELQQVITDNLGFYLGTKLCSEILLDSYKNCFDVVLLRLFFVYGPHQDKGMLIPRMIESIKMGAPLNLSGEEGISINPIYVDDSAKAITKTIDLQGHYKFNIAGSEILSLRSLASLIGTKLAISPKFIFTDGKSNSLIGDNSKMIKYLYKPGINISEGIDKLLTENLSRS